MNVECYQRSYGHHREVQCFTVQREEPREVSEQDLANFSNALFPILIFVIPLIAITVFLPNMISDYQKWKKRKSYIGRRVKVRHSWRSSSGKKGTVIGFHTDDEFVVKLDDGGQIYPELSELIIYKTSKKEVTKKKGLRMPRILRFISWSLVVALLWKFVANIETIAPYIINLLTTK